MLTWSAAAQTETETESARTTRRAAAGARLCIATGRTARRDPCVGAARRGEGTGIAAVRQPAVGPLTDGPACVGPTCQGHHCRELNCSGSRSEARRGLDLRGVAAWLGGGAASWATRVRRRDGRGVKKARRRRAHRTLPVPRFLPVPLALGSAPACRAADAPCRGPPFHFRENSASSKETRTVFFCFEFNEILEDHVLFSFKLF